MDHEREQGRQTGDEAREERIKRLIHAAVTHCGACRRAYLLDDFSVIGHRDHLWMVTVICEGCHNQGFITAIVEQPERAADRRPDRGGAPATGRRERHTDLTPAERERFVDAPPVGVDDLLDLSVFLDDFDGDFRGLLNGDQGDRPAR